MIDKEEEFVKNVNIDKAKNQTNLPILLISISILTYVIPLFWGEFDFGIIFEIASLVILLIARNFMSSYNEIWSKRFVVCAIFLIVWILVYDILFLFSYMESIYDLFIISYIYIFREMILILYVIMLFRVNRSLSKADNPAKYEESTDWFYEQYEKNRKQESIEKVV